MINCDNKIKISCRSNIIIVMTDKEKYYRKILKLI